MSALASASGSDLLARILAEKREEVAARRARVSERELEQQARKQVRRPFAPMRKDYSPADIARSYEAAGARALSVLTDEPHFGGTLDHLRQAREATRLPALRKDFIIDPYQVTEAAAAGADAVLLIVAAVDDSLLRALLVRAGELALDALVEVHTEAEVDRAAEAGAHLIGVNNRNLSTLETTLETSLRLRSRLPTRAIPVSESGLKTAGDLAQLEAAGYRAFLIGEQFMTAPDPGAALRALL
jgi:indole-3-glycerol phosphate synthase